jgi:F-type H+-transporting ATPase subunit delta
MTPHRQVRRTARRLFRDCIVDGYLDDDRVRRVVMTVIDEQRRSGLGVLSELQRLVRLEHDRHSALVQSAVPVPSDVRAGITRDLTHRYGPGLAIAFTCDPELIGGLRIRVGSDIYDGTIKGRLAALEDRF